MTSSSDRKTPLKRTYPKGKEPFIQSWMLYVTGAAVVVAVTLVPFSTGDREIIL